MGGFLIVSLLLAVLNKETEAKAGWSYSKNSQGNDSDWKHLYPLCDGQKQSPIDLNVDAAVLKADLSELMFNGYSSLQNGTMKNTGHSLQYNPKGSNRPTLQGGPVGGSTYTLEQFHFHFGSKDLTGSEHTINGFQYAAEVHFVHYNSGKYPSFATAVNESDGLAVVGVFFEVGDTNPQLDLLHIDRMLYKDNVSDVSLLKLQDLLPGSQRDYYSYSGSLTTPPCYESVKWIVMKDASSMSSDQMTHFRRTLSAAYSNNIGDVVADNYRVVQPLNGRQVVRNFEKETPTVKQATPTSPSSDISVIALIYVQLLSVALVLLLLNP
ncbi:carbonic anhydrase 1-like [Corticium candelabrum]|uniref:carbonic anhydrase 1-like n=1 Tax=Corticium candelabrum TaxID=121492 RepID=UPI002E26715E|nr:carbonic anhydrase 1-like [Corticium candelabrum]